MSKDDLTPENLPKMTETEMPARDEEQQTEFALTDEEAARAMEFFREEQNLLAGAGAGFLTAVIGAAVWAAVTIAAGYQIGWVAVGIGILVGLAVRMVGKGIDPVFGVVGALMTLLGCVLANVFTIAWYVSVDTGKPVIDVLSEMDVEIIIDLMLDTFQIMDILFYAMAIYFGYRYAIRELTLADYHRALGKAM